MSRAVLWDLDGTLIDSEEYHWQAWRAAIAAEGVAITREQFLATFGQRNDAIIPQLLDGPVDAARIERIGDAKEVHYRRLVKEGGLAPLAGVADWLARLQAEGWRQAIASSAPRLNVEVVLETIAMAGMFQAIISAEDVHRGKPDPEVFLVAAARLEVPAERCIVVEDAAAGVEAARRAGMRSIAVRPNLREADLAVSSLASLPPKAFDNLLLE